MFDLKEFIVRNIVSGIKNGSFAKEYGNIMAVNYLAKGLLTEEDVQSIDAQITEWEEQKRIEAERKKQEAMNTPVVIPEILPEEETPVKDEVVEPEFPMEDTPTVIPELQPEDEIIEDEVSEEETDEEMMDEPTVIPEIEE